MVLSMGPYSCKFCRTCSLSGTISLEIKWPKREANHSTSYGASLRISGTILLHGVDRDNFTFCRFLLNPPAFER
jgi:hypothetical protein